MAEPGRGRITYAEYLLAEDASDTKHEYLRGEVFAMAGGTADHSRLAAQLITELNIALRDRPCAVFTSDLRVRIDATDLSTYPDVSVICGGVEHSAVDPVAATNPLLIVEVLSNSTAASREGTAEREREAMEASDRGEKFAHYRRLPSLREYVLVSQHEPRIESYFRNAEDEWVLREARVGERLSLRALAGVEIAVDAVYRDPFT